MREKRPHATEWALEAGAQDLSPALPLNFLSLSLLSAQWVQLLKAPSFQLPIPSHLCPLPTQGPWK